MSEFSDSFAISTKNVPCGAEGITCTKAIQITVSGVRIRLILGAPPSLNDVALQNGKTTFIGGEIEVNDMFQYVKLDADAEILYDTGKKKTMVMSSKFVINCLHIVEKDDIFIRSK